MTIPNIGIKIPNMGMISSGLSNVLFSKARQRVLGLLYGQPDRSFHTNEVIRLTSSGTGAIQRELATLRGAGIITTKSIGNQKHYAANRMSPLFSELRSIVLKTFGLVDVLRQDLEPIVSQIRIAFIYGYIAKQENSINSDIDLMLLSDNLTHAVLSKLLKNSETQLGRPINPIYYSLAEWRIKIKANNNFVTQLLQQPKIFLIGNEDELIKLG